MADALVAALGHMFRDLTVEAETLSRADIAIVDANRLDDQAIEARGVQGLLLGAFTTLDRERLGRLRSCRGIVRYGIGVDNVDLEAAREAGIIVCNVPDYCLEEVAVHALTCALALLRGLPYWDASVRAGAWRGSNPPALRRPSSCSLGVIGFGQIGRALEARARAIFGTILVHDPWYRPQAGQTLGASTTIVSDLNALLRAVDVVSIHVPLTPDTRDLLNESTLGMLKPGAVVINASRGGIVNEAALLEAVRSGHLAGAALDTFAREPLPKEDELLGERRILLSPHVAWRSHEAEIALRRGAAEEIARILTGQTPKSQVTG